MNNELQQLVTQAQQAYQQLAIMAAPIKNQLLLKFAEALENNRSTIIEANQLDLLDAKKNSLSSALVDRLYLSDQGINQLVSSLKQIANFTDPVGEIIDSRAHANGMTINKVRVPIGVIAVIYESRPNVTVDVAALCLKSGNGVIWRGGKEA